MVNVALGAAAKSEIVPIRMTKAEKLWLAKEYGTAGKGLRALVEKEKRRTRDLGANDSLDITERGTR